MFAFLKYWHTVRSRPPCGLCRGWLEGGVYHQVSQYDTYWMRHRYCWTLWSPDHLPAMVLLSCESELLKAVCSCSAVSGSVALRLNSGVSKASANKFISKVKEMLLLKGKFAEYFPPIVLCLCNAFIKLYRALLHCHITQTIPKGVHTSFEWL